MKIAIIPAEPGEAGVPAVTPWAGASPNEAYYEEVGEDRPMGDDVAQ